MHRCLLKGASLVCVGSSYIEQRILSETTTASILWFFDNLIDFRNSSAVTIIMVNKTPYMYSFGCILLLWLASKNLSGSTIEEVSMLKD